MLLKLARRGFQLKRKAKVGVKTKKAFKNTLGFISLGLCLCQLVICVFGFRCV